jgi:hypothetical protein
MLRWIEDPPAQAPGTAMPRTGASGRQGTRHCRPSLHPSLNGAG